MKFTKNDEAVSPVIGVILMVAITVILAAVIAAFVFGMAGNINQNKVVSVTVERISGDSVVMTYQGGQDAGTLEVITWTYGDNVAAGSIGSVGTVLPIGSVYTLNVAIPVTSKVVGVATFSDGTQQVIIDKMI